MSPLDFTGVTTEQLAGVIATTLPHIRQPSLSVAFERRTYEIVNRWHTQEKIQTMGGNRIEHKIMLDDSGNARFVLPYEPDQPNVDDHVHTMKVDWRTANTHYGWERKEILMNMGPAQIVSLLKTRRIDGMVDVANLIEGNGWQQPDPNDNRVPFGIFYYVPKLASGQNGEGWYGGHPAGFNDVAGIEAATNNGNTPSITGGERNWRSYQAGGTGYYEGINMDFVDTFDRAFIALEFESPTIVSEVTEGPLRNLRIYANLDTISAYKRFVRLHNDQVGPDIGSFAGSPAFNRIPLKYISQLNSDSSDPVYMINHTFFETRVLRGDNLRETPPKVAPWQHNVVVVFVDHTYNYLCTNRQRNGVINKT